jgi:hypothetical protein
LRGNLQGSPKRQPEHSIKKVEPIGVQQWHIWRIQIQMTTLMGDDWASSIKGDLKGQAPDTGNRCFNCMKDVICKLCRSERSRDRQTRDSFRDSYRERKSYRRNNDYEIEKERTMRSSRSQGGKSSSAVSY